MVGLTQPEAGQILLQGKDIAGWSVDQVRDSGVAFVPEDRHEQGLVLSISLWENSVLGRQDDAQFSGRIVLFIRAIKELAADLIRRFDVRARNINVTAGTCREAISRN